MPLVKIDANNFWQMLERNKSLFPFILLAFIFHAVLLMKLRLPNGIHPAKQTALEIYIQHHDISELLTAKAPESNNADGSAPTDVIKKPYKNRSNANEPNEASSGLSKEVFAPAGIQMTEDKYQDKQVITTVIHDKTIDIQSILDSAHRIATDMGKSYPDKKESLTSLMDRPVLPKLAMILETKRTVAGALEYADGIIKIVTESGSTYCMQSKISPLTNVPPDGPVKAEGIATTCP